MPEQRRLHTYLEVENYIQLLMQILKYNVVRITFDFKHYILQQ